MKTSWNDIALIERYLDEQLDADELRAFDDRLTMDSAFKQNVSAQSHVRQLVRKHFLLRMRKEARELHDQFYNDPTRRPMRLAIDALFKP